MVEALQQAVQLIFDANGALWPIIALSLRVSLIALMLAALIGLPAGAWLGLTQFRGKPFALAMVYTSMGLPPVVAGVVVYLLLSRTGPLGNFGWLFSPVAMVIAQVVIATPLITGFVMSAVQGVDPDLRRQLHGLGATPLQSAMAVLHEARPGILIALVAAFGRLVSEVGAVMLVGGNVEGQTRVLTTAIVLETRQGRFDAAIALGAILLALSFLANITLLAVQQRYATRARMVTT